MNQDSQLFKVGEQISILMKNGSPMLAGPLRHLVQDTWTLSGKVVIKPGWVTDRFSLAIWVAGDMVPMRIVSLRDAISINGRPVKQPTTRQRATPVPVRAWKVKGSKNAVYDVVNTGGSWTCTCLGFGFRHTCKHINELKESK